MTKTKRRNKRIMTILVAVAIVLFCAISGVQIVKIRHKNAELAKRKERLETLLEDEQVRQAALEDEAVYVQTRKYIEEKAKSIGYVYPDEIIFRKDE